MNLSVIIRAAILFVVAFPCFASNAIALNLNDHKTYDADQFVGSARLCFKNLKKYASENSYLNWSVNNSRREIVHKEDLGYYREKDARNIHMRCQSNGNLYISVRVPEEERYRYQQDAGEVVRQTYDDFMGFVNKSASREQ